MINTRFWNNKNYVEDWIDNLNLNIKYSINTLGKGSRGVKLYIFSDINIQEFIKTYSGTESKYASFYLTSNYYTRECPIYVSISKFGYYYGSKIKRKSKYENRIN